MQTILAVLNRLDTAHPVLVVAGLLAARSGADITVLHVRRDPMEGFMPTEDIMTEQRLREIGLDSVSEQPVRELAYGEQRLLEIAIGLALRPRVLLLDEPAAGVPSGEVSVIHSALARLPADMAILLIEHDMDLVFRFATEIVVLVQGSVLSRGSPEQTRRDPRESAALKQ